MRLSKKGKNFLIGIWLMVLSVLSCIVHDETVPILLGVTGAFFMNIRYDRKDN